jgi:ABC-type Zn2+ transport system substrate-binding protein/surface adhesin
MCLAAAASDPAIIQVQLRQRQHVRSPTPAHQHTYTHKHTHTHTHKHTHTQQAIQRSAPAPPAICPAAAASDLAKVGSLSEQQTRSHCWASPQFGPEGENRGSKLSSLTPTNLISSKQVWWGQVVLHLLLSLKI